MKKALTPLFKKSARDAEHTWVYQLLYRINGLLLIEMGAAFALALLLKANSVDMDDSISCVNGVASVVRHDVASFIRFHYPMHDEIVDRMQCK